MAAAIRRVLVTGGSGYIGSNICKIMAALNPKIEVVSLSIDTVPQQIQTDPYKARFKNIEFVEANCLDPHDTRLVESVSQSDAVIHTVGTLLEAGQAFDYRQFITDFEQGRYSSQDPVIALQNLLNEINKRQNSIPTTVYEKSHEGLNRDSCINVAKILAESSDHKKNLVFFSASDSIVPMLSKYCEMKREAESFLLRDALVMDKLNPVILRPGLVYSQNQRAWTLPLKFFTDVGFCVNQNVIANVDFPGKDEVQKVFPQSGSISLGKVTDFAIDGAKGKLPERDESTLDHERKCIWTNEDMNKF